MQKPKCCTVIEMVTSTKHVKSEKRLWSVEVQYINKYRWEIIKWTTSKSNPVTGVLETFVMSLGEKNNCNLAVFLIWKKAAFRYNADMLHFSIESKINPWFLALSWRVNVIGLKHLTILTGLVGNPNQSLFVFNWRMFLEIQYFRLLEGPENYLHREVCLCVVHIEVEGNIMLAGKWNLQGTMELPSAAERYQRLQSQPVNREARGRKGGGREVSSNQISK